MRVLDLFAGIGGFSLAAHWMGWETVAFVEKEKFCQKVLAKNFPGVPIYGDIFEFDGKPFRGSVDIVCGGFPCQPFSTAGKRKGRSDERAIFPQMLRVVEESQPRWVVAENVRGLLSIESGDIFEGVAASLECVGYEVQAFCVPASAIDAPHRRERIWIVAHSESFGTHRESGEIRRANGRPDGRLLSESGNTDSFIADPNSIRGGTGLGEIQSTNGEISERYDDAELGNADLCVANATDSTEQRLSQPGLTGERQLSAESCRGLHDRPEQPNRDVADCNIARLQGRMLQDGSERPQSDDKQSIGCGGNWGESWIEAATRLCRMDDVVPNRVDRLKSLGNAVVPQLVFEIFKAIEAAETLTRQSRAGL